MYHYKPLKSNEAEHFSLTALYRKYLEQSTAHVVDSNAIETFQNGLDKCSQNQSLNMHIS